ncbi:hypothetical protein [Streptomyces sp. NPDC089799]|uniref:hypothetical protein n=1 Tax=Streptomyces sp. NPDC089799 TaxID=3155066 RepID=UPI0034171E6D
MSKLKRVLGVMAATAMAGALPILAASPASANQGDCAYYLNKQGYKVGPKVWSACSNAPIITGLPHPACYGGLVSLGVNPGHASEACRQAKR